MERVISSIRRSLRRVTSAQIHHCDSARAIIVTHCLRSADYRPDTRDKQCSVPLQASDLARSLTFFAAHAGRRSNRVRCRRAEPTAAVGRRELVLDRTENRPIDQLLLIEVRSLGRVNTLQTTAVREDCAASLKYPFCCIFLSFEYCPKNLVIDNESQHSDVEKRERDREREQQSTIQKQEERERERKSETERTRMPSFRFHYSKL